MVKKCELCNKPASMVCENEDGDKLKFIFHFCRNCFSKGTMIVSIWRWKLLNPKYKHPVIDIKAEDSFKDIAEKYLALNEKEMVN